MAYFIGRMPKVRVTAGFIRFTADLCYNDHKKNIRRVQLCRQFYWQAVLAHGSVP